MLRNCSQCENLDWLNLKNIQFSSDEIVTLIPGTTSCEKLQSLSLSQNSLQDRGVEILLKNNSHIWKYLENLNLAGNYIGKTGAKILSCNPAFVELRHLDLSHNHIGNDGIMLIAGSSSWSELRVLMINDISVDSYGMKFLSENESWKNLRELYLQINPLVGDLGAIQLSHNKSWKHLNVLVLDDSNVGILGLEGLRRNRVWKNCIVQERSQRNSLDHKLALESLNITVEGVTSLAKSHIGNEFSRDFTERKFVRSSSSDYSARCLLSQMSQRRGGGEDEQGNAIENELLCSLSAKVIKYITRIQNDPGSLEDEQKLYIVPLGKLSSCINDSNSDLDPELFDLATETVKRLLAPESPLKVLLLNGNVGYGKTLFCKYLQRLILPATDTLFEESDERVWIPIFVDLSHSKNPKQSLSTTATLTLSEILNQELSLTEDEIKLLQSNELNKALPHFLFIFDEFNQVLLQKKDSVGPCTLDDCIQNNFCLSVGFESYWKNAKLIVACRSDALYEIPKHDMLFGPLEGATNTPIPKTFLEFVFCPFTDAQISSYLMKYYYFTYPVDLDTDEKFPLLGLESWSCVKKFESLIDAYQLRQLCRVPLLLSLIVSVLSQKTEDSTSIKGVNVSEEVANAKADNKKNSKKKTRSRKEQPNKKVERNVFEELNHYKLFEIVTKRSIDITVKRMLALKSDKKTEAEENFLSQRLNQQLQNLALRLSYYPISQEAEIQQQKEQKENDELFALCPLLKFEGNSDGKGIVFIHKSFRDFFLAKKMEEEIIKISESEDLIDPTTMLLNQNLLFDGSAVSISVFQFLVEAALEKKFSEIALLVLIEKCNNRNIIIPKSSEKKSKRKVLKASELQEDYEEIRMIPQETERPHRHNHQDHYFSKANANAITLLNMLGYAFKNLDFNKICITGANLSNGILTGANFSGADLQGVNFSGSCLYEVDLAKSNMNGVKFGRIPDILLDQEAACIEHSPDGNHLLIGSADEIIVFKKNLAPELFYGEIRRLTSNASFVNNCSFSSDGLYIISGGVDGSIYVWDFENEKSAQVIRGHTRRVLKCEFSEDRKQMLSAEEENIIKKWVVSNERWIPSLQLDSPGKITNCGFLPNFNRIMFVGQSNLGSVFYHSVTGRHIHKFKTSSRTIRCKAGKSNPTPDGKQIAIRSREEYPGEHAGVHVFDCIRGHLTKYFEHSTLDPVFSQDGTQIISLIQNTEWGRVLNHTISIQNVALGEHELSKN